MDIATIVLDYLKVLVWPIVVILVICIFRSPIFGVIYNITKLKYKDLELEFSKELEKAENKAQELNLPKSDKLKQAVEQFSAVGSSYDRLFQLSSISPRASIMETWLILESTLEESAQKLGYKRKPHQLYTEIVSFLVDQKALPENTLSLYNNLRKLRNTAVHAIEPEIDSEDANRFIDLALGLAFQIRSAMSEPEK
jgi:hypothetical protein